jgi:adenylate cyclase
MPSIHQLAAIMVIDIVDYPALMEEDKKQLEKIIEHYHAALNKVVSFYRGKVLNDCGNGSLCIFESATEAVNCSLSLQTELQSEPVAPLRIGLHIGEIFIEEDKVLGDGVKIASHIQSLGKANTILLSKELFDKIKNHPEFKAISLGHFTFDDINETYEVFALTNLGLNVPKRQTSLGKQKNISNPIGKTNTRKRNTHIGRMVIAAAIIVLISGAFFLYNYSFNRSFLPEKENSIAVLYFDNMSGDPEQDYFCDGITEEITSRLSMISGLRVKSRTTVLQYKSEKKTAKEIADELGVNNILEGSIRKDGNRIRVTVQLIDAQKDEHIWSENYDRELKNIFDLQSEIAQQVAAKFGMKLSNDDQKEITTSSTQNTEAYDNYLQAHNLTFIESGLGGEYSNTQKAIALLRQAIQIDPAFSDAYALLSKNYSYYSRVAPDSMQMPDAALLMAKKAIQYGEGRVNGYEALAYAYYQKGNLNEALKWLLKCHEMVPYSTVGTSAITDIVDIYLKKNNYGTAMEWLLKAIEYDSTEIKYYIKKAEVFERLGLLDSVQQNIDIAKRMSPEKANAQLFDALIYLYFGWNYEDYRSLVKSALPNEEKEITYKLGIFYLFHRDWEKAGSLYSISSNPDDMDAGLVYMHLGNIDLGTQFLNKAIEQRRNVKGSLTAEHYSDISRAYAALKDPRYAEYLDKAMQKGWHNYAFFTHDPFYDFVRDEPEFKRLNQQMNERNERFKSDVNTILRKFYER